MIDWLITGGLVGLVVFLVTFIRYDDKKDAELEAFKKSTDWLEYLANKGK